MVFALRGGERPKLLLQQRRLAETLQYSVRRPEAAQSLELLVDTGSTYTWVSATVLRALGIEPSECRTIQGRATERSAAEALITLEGRTLYTTCLCGESGDRARTEHVAPRSTPRACLEGAEFRPGGTDGAARPESPPGGVPQDDDGSGSSALDSSRLRRRGSISRAWIAAGSLSFS